jgi:hypothetical protein
MLALFIIASFAMCSTYEMAKEINNKYAYGKQNNNMFALSFLTFNWHKNYMYIFTTEMPVTKDR